MARTKQTIRKFQTKRPASSTHSSQEDSRPRKTLKPGHDEDAASSHSDIQMINSRDLNAWRRAQRQLIPAPTRDEFMQARGGRPPLQGAGVRRRARAAFPEPSPEEVEEEEEEEREVGHHVSYGASSNRERDQRISGWAGSVASAGAGNPDVGVEDDQASVVGSSPSAARVVDAQDEDGEDNETDEDEAPADQVVPSIETGNVRTSNTRTGNARTSTAANTRAAAPAQSRSQPLRRCARLRQNAEDTHVSIARIDDVRFDPVAHLRKPHADLHHLSNDHTEAFVGDKADANTTFKRIRQAFLGGPRPDNIKPFKAGDLKKLGITFATYGTPIKTSEGLRPPANAFLGASKQNAAIEYFDRDHPGNHGRSPIDTSTSSSNDAGGDYFPICTLKYGGSPSLDEMSSCASPFGPCHDVVILRHSRRYGKPGPGDAWRYRPIQHSISAASPSEVESYDDRDYFAHEQNNLDSGSEAHEDRDYFAHEQHNLEYGSEAHDDRDFFPMQTCVLDYDGEVKPEKPTSGAGDSAEEGDELTDRGYDGSASGNSPSAGESNAGEEEAQDNGGDHHEDAGSASGDFYLADESAAAQEDSEDDDSEGEEQEIKSEPSESGSDNSDEDAESNESVKGSEDESAFEDEDAVEDESANVSSNNDDNNTTVLPRMNHDPLGRVRPPGTPLSPPQPIFHPDPPFYTPQTRHTTVPDVMTRPNIDSAAIAAANALAGYDVSTSGIRPPPRAAFRPREGLRFAGRGGMPDASFAGPKARQNTAPNRLRDETLAPGQGYVSVSIAEQQSAHMLLAHERVEIVEGEEREGGSAEDGVAEDGGAKDEDGEGEDAEVSSCGVGKVEGVIACSTYDMVRRFP